MKLDKKIITETFEEYKITKGVYDNDISVNGKNIIKVDHYGNILFIYDSNLRSILGSLEFPKFMNKLNGNNVILGDSPFLYIKCNELKLCANTYTKMSEYLYELDITSNTNSTYLNETHKINGDKFMFKGYCFEVVREGDIYE